MRIAIVAGPFVPVPPPKYGGTERVIGHLIEGLKELGHEVILIGPADSTVDCTILPSVDKALWFPRHKKDRSAYDKKVRAAMEATYHLVKSVQNKVDIIHSHGMDMLPFRRFPNVTTIHNPLTLEQIPYYLRRRSLKYICISQNQTKVLPSLSSVGVVYNGLRPSEFPFIKRPKDYVTFIGRFDREKNPHLAIQLALSLGIKIKLAGKLDFLGDGYFESEIQPHLDNPLVEYLGEIGFDEKVELLAHARCNFHPTGFREPFGLTVLEAAYCGTPTLAISLGSMPELIINNKTGILVEDFVEGYEAYKRCLALDRKHIARYARDTFNYQSMSRDYVKLYQKTIDDFNHRGFFGKLRRLFAPTPRLKSKRVM